MGILAKLHSIIPRVFHHPSGVYQPVFSIRQPQSTGHRPEPISHPASHTQYPASNTEHQTSSIQIPASIIPSLPSIPTGSLISIQNISKRFGTLWANKDISLEVLEGEIHAIVGENGAGKSTLMKILYGHLRADRGRICLRGKPVVFAHPREAIQAGIGMVHQQLLIFPQLSAMENIVVGSESQRWGWLKKRDAEERLQQLCDLFGFDLPLRLPAKDLPFAQRQQIELLRVVHRGARILILDEPTSLLAPLETQKLLDLLLHLKSNGHTVLFISHRLREVFSIADRISILRGGKCTGTLVVPETTVQQIAKLIFPAEKDSSSETVEETGGGGSIPASPRPLSTGPLLALENVTALSGGQDPGLENFSLQVQHREILGIGAVVGNGERLLAQVLAGMTPVKGGRIFFDGKSIEHWTIKDRINAGVRWLPANPAEEGLLSTRPIWENLLLGSQREPFCQSGGWLLKGQVLAWTKEQLASGKVAYTDVDEPVNALSGGNQQKLVLSRVMGGAPRLLILEQPGRGLDIRAQDQLRDRLWSLNEKGTTIIMFSYDLDELLRLCHRIGILYRGLLMGIVQRQEASVKELGRWMLGLTAEL